MSETLEPLIRRIRSFRARWGTVASAWISIARKPGSRKFGRLECVALIDGRIRVDLLTGPSRRLRVLPGEHEVVVYFGPSRPRIRIGSAAASIRVVLRPGEQTRLRFLEQPEWRRFDALWRRECMAAVTMAIVVAAAAWLGFPSLRDAIARMTLSVGIRQPWLSLCDMVVRGRLMTMVLAVDAWALFVALPVMGSYRRRYREFEEQFGKRYRLVQPSEDSGPRGVIPQSTAGSSHV